MFPQKRNPLQKDPLALLRCRRQLNRVINWDGGRLEDVAPIAAKIKTSSDWKRELIALGDQAILENRTANAIA